MNNKTRKKTQRTRNEAAQHAQSREEEEDTRAASGDRMPEAEDTRAATGDRVPEAEDTRAATGDRGLSRHSSTTSSTRDY